MIPLPECKKRTIYKVNSRNLLYGVYDGNEGFLGIRQKFDYKFLFTEYHYDQGAPHGTVRPIEPVEVLPDWIDLKHSLGTICRNCGLLVKSIPITDKPVPVRWEHIPFETYNDETDETLPFKNGCEEASPLSLGNPYLFDFLDNLEKR